MTHADAPTAARARPNEARPRPRPIVLVLAALGLFSLWSNSFIAIGYLLGADGVTARFDWVGLTVARFLPAALVSAAFLAIARRREALEAIRRHPVRLVTAAACVVPFYSFALYYAQQHGIPAPIASLTTALVPLFVMVLAALFLGERPTPRRLLGFVVAMTGMTVIALSKREAAGGTYPLLVAIAAMAPLSWSVYSVVSKPLAGRVSPVVWTYLATTVGGVALLPLLPGAVARDLVALDRTGWGALLYLSIPCTVIGNAVWTWLLRHLPASSVGFTVFLNPPLTTVSKSLFASFLPASFAFTIGGADWAGGALTLVGLAIAVARRRSG